MTIIEFEQYFSINAGYPRSAITRLYSNSPVEKVISQIKDCLEGHSSSVVFLKRIEVKDGFKEPQYVHYIVTRDVLANTQGIRVYEDEANQYNRINDLPTLKDVDKSLRYQYTWLT